MSAVVGVVRYALDTDNEGHRWPDGPTAEEWFLDHVPSTHRMLGCLRTEEHLPVRQGVMTLVTMDMSVVNARSGEPGVFRLVYANEVYP